MPCNDPLMVNLRIAQPGDQSRFWITNCPMGFYIGGQRTIVQNGASTEEALEEHRLTPGSPLTHTLQVGQGYIVSVVFDKGGGPGRSAEVHAELLRGGAVVHQWCATVTNANPDADAASYALKVV